MKVLSTLYDADVVFLRMLPAMLACSRPRCLPAHSAPFSDMVDVFNDCASMFLTVEEVPW